jgi:P-type E1-E2 ATPase
MSLPPSTPECKIAQVCELQQQGTVVVMIGDGVNDAPSLAQADAGIALGTGADIAMQAAPIILMGSGLDGVLAAIDLARRTVRAVRQNLFWAFVYNTTGITLAAAGVVNPIVATARWCCRAYVSSVTHCGSANASRKVVSPEDLTRA